MFLPAEPDRPNQFTCASEDVDSGKPDERCGQERMKIDFLERIEKHLPAKGAGQISGKCHNDGGRQPSRLQVPET